MAESEIARLRQQIADEYQAAKTGLSGLASGISAHQFITARMENMQQCQKQLIVLIGDEREATMLVVETLDSVLNKEMLMLLSSEAEIARRGGM